MSYILEALKKAQAERQLGSAPTIHAPQAAAPVAHAGAASRKPLFVGLGAGALVVAAGALLLWRQYPATPASVAATAPASAAAAAGAAPAAAPAAAPVSPVIAHGGAQPAVQSAGRPADTLALSTPPAPAVADDTADASAAAARTRAPAHAAGSATETSPARVADAAAGPSVPAPAPLSAAPPATPAAPRTSASSSTAPTPAPRAPASSAVRVAATTAPASAPAARTPAPEDNLPFLQQLPEAQQRDLPRVTFGGYMYSANPADRLLLVDKALRHEGEEVAPGLVLEKLLPKAAVMNYRGLRYRVAY